MCHLSSVASVSFTVCSADITLSVHILQTPAVLRPASLVLPTHWVLLPIAPVEPRFEHTTVHTPQLLTYVSHRPHRKPKPCSLLSNHILQPENEGAVRVHPCSQNICGYSHQMGGEKPKAKGVL